MTTGIALITDERARQMSVEGWTPEHDDEHTDSELAQAATCYATADPDANPAGDPPTGWPWAPEWWKPSLSPVRNLVKAGALIAAEIDRILRIRVWCIGSDGTEFFAARSEEEMRRYYIELIGEEEAKDDFDNYFRELSPEEVDGEIEWNDEGKLVKTSWRKIASEVDLPTQISSGYN